MFTFRNFIRFLEIITLLKRFFSPATRYWVLHHIESYSALMKYQQISKLGTIYFVLQFFLVIFSIIINNQNNK